MFPCPKHAKSFTRQRIWLVLSIVVVVVGPSGCKFLQHGSAVAAKPKPIVQPVAPLPVDLTKYQPNEAGDIPILEYHKLVTTNRTKDLEYPAALFRRDLEWLYAHNFRPINLSDYVHGRIDCPAGMSPVILTFDDAWGSQFNYLPDGRIDPNCAVGILDDFHARHPDWPLRGIFFVLTNGDKRMPPTFYQAGREQEKLEYLVKEGFEIGNHTVHHQMGIRHWPDARVEAEFAGAVTNIQVYLPGYPVDMLALPFGVYPKNQKLVISGESGGVAYHNICALLAGAGPAPSPVTKAYKPYRLPRIIPGNQKFALQWWEKKLEADTGERFVSDGDPNTYTVSMDDKGSIEPKLLSAGNYFLRTYSGDKVVSVVGPGMDKPSINSVNRVAGPSGTASGT